MTVPIGGEPVGRFLPRCRPVRSIAGPGTGSNLPEGTAGNPTQRAEAFLENRDSSDPDPIDVSG